MNRPVKEALQQLGVDSLQLSIFDPSFPGGGTDIGRGSPYSRAADQLLRFVADLGFTGLQLGPQGLTSASNPSPYDGTLFSRNPLNVDLEQLVEEGRLSAEGLARAVTPGGSTARRVQYTNTHHAQRVALLEAWRHQQQHPDQALADFEKANARWLVPDALYEALAAEHEGRWHEDWDPERFPLDGRLYQPLPGEEAACAARLAELSERYQASTRRYAFEQWLVHRQHLRLREVASALGLSLFGDLQVGLSPRDLWAHGGVFLKGLLLGAPPSRTTAEGQPWGYRVLDPDQAHLVDGAPGPALQFLRARMSKMFAEYDGVRIDHPHGLVSPWVYRAGEDGGTAVRAGGRLYSSPDLDWLQRYAIARPEQLDRSRPRYADDWERDLEPQQIDRYALWMDEVVEQCRARGQAADALVCEVLSTCPLPLRKVLERHGLGRFRVTQKANLTDPADVYRSENAKPADLVMLGNHDTPPIWQVIARWEREGQLPARVAYLASRLTPPGRSSTEWASEHLSSTGAIAQACFADLFASPARHVLVFFTDLFGIDESFNVPGLQSTDNWSLRLTAKDVADYPERAHRGEALSLPRALTMALQARHPGSPVIAGLATDRSSRADA